MLIVSFHARSNLDYEEWRERQLTAMVEYRNKRELPPVFLGEWAPFDLQLPEPEDVEICGDCMMNDLLENTMEYQNRLKAILAQIPVGYNKTERETLFKNAGFYLGCLVTTIGVMTYLQGEQDEVSMFEPEVTEATS